MKDSADTRTLVREKYSEIAKGESSCCGKRTAASTYAGMGETYAAVEGYVPEADLGLGCGVPTELAQIKEGDVVLDLGSGAGNDVFIARREVGPEGRVIGVDFSAEMLERARANMKKLGYANIDFLEGEIEALPLADGRVDVVISNCVLNLVPDKSAAFREIHRVLKPGGHFCVSDIVLEGELPEKMRKAAEFQVGCVAGALQRKDYLYAIAEQGFEAIEAVRERAIVIPDADLLEVLTPEELEAFRESGTAITSLTIRASKPGCARGSACGGSA